MLLELEQRVNMSEHDHNNGTSTSKPNQEQSSTDVTTADTKTIKNNKQQRKMARILAKAWNLENARMFQQISSSEYNEGGLDLTSIGQRLDTGHYNDLELGWKQFSSELGYVYNRIITSNTDNSAHKFAKDNLNQVTPFLSKVNIDYGRIASNSVSPPIAKKKKKKKKRKYLEQEEKDCNGLLQQEPVTLNCHVPKKKMLNDNHTNRESSQAMAVSSSTNDKMAPSLTLTQREELALNALQDYIEGFGGSRDQVIDYRIRMRPNTNNIDYFSPQGRYFKTKKEIAKHLGLRMSNKVNSISNKEENGNSNKATLKISSNKKKIIHKKKLIDKNKNKKARQSKNNDYKKLQKELERLRKAHRKATKTLEDKKHKINSHNDQEEDLIPDEKFINDEQKQNNSSILHEPDNLLCFHSSLPKECISDLMMIYDFVCSFNRVLLLDPIDLEEFEAVLCHSHEKNQNHNNGVNNIATNTTINTSNYFPVYLAEIHLCILKVLFNDQSSDDWWWSTLETPLMEMETTSSSGGIVTLNNTNTAPEEPIESESSDEENLVKEEGKQESNNASVATSYIPPKPVPSFIDLLLPPSKPPNYLLTPHTWPALTGAACHRILHKYKRQRNEVDDEIREAATTGVPLSLNVRRGREEVASQRIFSECLQHDLSLEQEKDVSQAIDHLTSGKPYLQLSIIQRLRLLRILVEALYDTHRIYSVLEDNYKARKVAQKQLEVEERKFKKRLQREKVNQQEFIARQRLANDAKFKFYKAKYIELMNNSNIDNNELPDEDSFIQDPTLILDFLDDENKDAYDALHTPDSFPRSEVNTMMSQIHDESLFDVDTDTTLITQNVYVEILTLQEIQDREDREMVNSSDENKEELESIRQSRNQAIDALKDVLEGGSATIKSLKSVIKLSKSNFLVGTSDTHIWALDLVRDALDELKSLENKIDLINAQKDLMNKRDKCFVRLEPIGEDRHRNRYWYFSHHDDDDAATNIPGKIYLEIENDHGIGFKEEQAEVLKDLTTLQNDNDDNNVSYSSPSQNSKFLSFCKKEYHPSGTISNLPNRSWGVYCTDASLRTLVKSLKENGIKESLLKIKLKEILESRQQSSPLATEAEVEDDTFTASLNQSDDGLENHPKETPPPLKSITDLSVLIQSYRNSMGKFTGRNNDAPYSSCPFFCTKFLLKKESEYYSRLARIQHSNAANNTWGGKNGLRNAWILSMKEVVGTTPYENALETVRNGLITLEDVFFELTGGVLAPEQIENTLVNGKDILHDDMKRMDIELESITGVQYGIWNSIESRLVFLEIISQPETSCGVLALGLDLICRNCDVYLKSIGANANSNRPRRNDLFYNEDIDETFDMTVGVTTRRRANAWQNTH